MGAVLTGCAAAQLLPECERPIDVRSDAGTTRLCDAERQEYELAMQVLGQIADRPRRTQEQRLANSCLQFIRALRDQAQAQRELGTDTGLAQLHERAKLLEQAHGG